jgi:hypothetical protein
MKVIKPPHPISKAGSNIKMVFLAGSIEMGIAEDWQSRVEEHFMMNHPDWVILNPRRDEWDSSWEQTITNPQFYQQVNWELNALEKCDMIIMYFSPDTKSPISLLELGKFAESSKMLVCCPEGFWRKGNVDIVCERYGIPNYETLNDLLQDLTFQLNE